MSLPPPLPSLARVSPLPEHPSLGIRLLGIVLVIPAILVALLTFWIPTLRLAQIATSHGIGVDFFDPTWGNEIWFSTAIAGIRLCAAIMAAVFGLTAAFLGAVGRNFFRTVFLIPILLLGPLSFGFSCMLLGQALGLMQSGHEALTLLAEGLFSFATLLLVALWLFPATRFDGTEKKSQLWPRLVLVIFLAIAAVATGLQAFGLPTTVNFLAGMNGNQSFAAHAMNLTYIFNQVGEARMNVLLLFVLGFLGTMAGVLLIATNLRLDFHRYNAVKKSPGWWIGLVLGLGCLIAVTAIVGIFFAGFQIYSAKFQHTSGEQAAPYSFAPLLSSLGNMTLPVLIWFVVSSFLTYLAAFGIGALRPLGRYSEWLLLPFFPYLFVSVVTLSPVFVEALSQMKLFDSPFSVLYPMLIFVPELIFLTLFFKGQVARRAQLNPRPSFTGGVLLPSIPVAFTFAVVATLMIVRDSYWSLAAISRLKTLPLLYFEGFENNSLYSLCYDPLAVSIGTLALLFPVLALLQIFVVDRLRIQT